MLAQVLSGALYGIDGYVVEVQVDLARGLPYFTMVGLPEGAVRESKDRVKSALKNCGYDVPRERVTVNLAPADIKKTGAGFDLPMAVALTAAQKLVQEGMDVEIVDLRTLVPLDKETILASVAKTGRLVVLHEATRTGGFGGEIAAVVMEEGFSFLKAPLRRVTGPDIPVPASPPLERFYIPSDEQLIAAIKEVV